MKTRIVGVSRFVAAASVSETMQFFNAYTRFMLAVALSIGAIVSILDNYLPG